ncbi:MAG: RDD family protein [Povalibacter sp.]
MSIAADYPLFPSLPRAWHVLIVAMLTLLLAHALPAFAQDVEQPATPPQSAPAAEPSAQPDVEATDTSDDDDDDDNGHHHNVIMRFSKDTFVPAQDTVDAVVTVSGSSTTEGHVREGVVSVFGNTRATGEVDEDAVALFGNVYVNNHVGGDVFALFGNVELGPQARVDGEVVVISGELIRDPAAKIRGDINEVTLPFEFGRFEWLRPWVKHCLLLGRPLAMEQGLGWAWSLAIGFLALYLVLALMFSQSVENCVKTLEQRPGRTLVASVLTLLLTPILTVLLMITVVGFAVVPFLWIALFLAGLFGKTVILAALGRRITRFTGSGPLSDVAIAVLIGGILVLGLYLIPVLGFIIYKVLGILSLGVVVYTLLIEIQAKREITSKAAAAAAGPGVTPTVETMAESSAAFDASASTADATSAQAAAAATVAASTIPELSLPRAGFWIRMGALFIDMVLIGVALSVLRSDGVFLLALAIYGAVMWKMKGTTVGGVVCHLKVIRVDGREIDWSAAAIRALSCFLSLALAGLGFLWIAFDPSRQAWHDKIAGTVVVRVPQGIPLV